MMAETLLKSCAMPPGSWLTDSSFAVVESDFDVAARCFSA
jgi:hypothetical protein